MCLKSYLGYQSVISIRWNNSRPLLYSDCFRSHLLTSMFYMKCSSNNIASCNDSNLKQEKMNESEVYLSKIKKTNVKWTPTKHDWLVFLPISHLHPQLAADGTLFRATTWINKCLFFASRESKHIWFGLVLFFLQKSRLVIVTQLPCSIL